MKTLMLVVILVDLASGVPFNQPRFCREASWNSNATVFAASGTVGSYPFGLFVNNNNTVYATVQDQHLAKIWFQENLNVSITTPNIFDRPRSVFALTEDDIFIDSGDNERVVRWSVSTSSIVSVFGVPDHCAGLFVDHNNTLYCSMPDSFLVISTSIGGNPNLTNIVAGNGSMGNKSYQLKWPNGIFVDSGFNLYVADTGNDRIQLFRPGQLNGTTIVASSIIGTSLNGPIGVVLDADVNLFILLQFSGRVIRSGPSGYRCVVACSGSPGSNLNQLDYPQSLSFDSYGNIFVTDLGNSRILEFTLKGNSCASTQTDQTATFLAPTVGTTEPEYQLFTIGSSEPLLTRSFGPSPSSDYFLPSCANAYFIGSSCNISSTPCDVLKPCQNLATCINNNTIPTGYVCQCVSGFYGSECELDVRPCTPRTCWNNGTCFIRNVDDFVCVCVDGWTGIHCETQINYCQNISCENGGVCRPLFRDYQCDCLSSSYSGRYCEVTAQTLVVRKVVSQSFGYIAIIFITAVAIFVVILDVLKYFFHIDPVREERERLRRQQLRPKKKSLLTKRRLHLKAISTKQMIIRHMEL